MVTCEIFWLLAKYFWRKNTPAIACRSRNRIRLFVLLPCGNLCDEGRCRVFLTAPAHSRGCHFAAEDRIQGVFFRHGIPGKELKFCTVQEIKPEEGLPRETIGDGQVPEIFALWFIAVIRNVTTSPGR